MNKQHLLIAVCWVLTTIIGRAQSPLVMTNKAKEQEQWVENTYKQMTLDEKIGQLFMVSLFSSHIGTKRAEEVKDWIKKYYIGGIIFSKGGPKRQVKLTNEYQPLSKIPLFMAMDAEWGLAMRLDSTFAYPWNMTMGAVKDNSLIERAGKRIGQHCKQIGMQFNFAPDIDINTNPANPIIGNRSFGEDKENVAQKGLAFTRGMQSVGVLGSAKHFPGHGDTAKDSHKTLPTINFTANRLEEVELYPFRALSKSVASVMVGHLNVPALEPKNGLPSSLSKTIITDLLKKKMGYEYEIYGILTDREELGKRIKKRVQSMFNEELYAECRKLASRYDFGLPAMKSNIYRYVWDYLNGVSSLEEAINLASTSDFQLAKRQMTWFKRNPEIKWYKREEILDKILEKFQVEHY